MTSDENCLLLNIYCAELMHSCFTVNSYLFFISLISLFRDASSAIWSPEPWTPVEADVAKTTPCVRPVLELVAIFKPLKSPVATEIQNLCSLRWNPVIVHFFIYQNCYISCIIGSFANLYYICIISFCKFKWWSPINVHATKSYILTYCFLRKSCTIQYSGTQQQRP